MNGAQYMAVLQRHHNGEKLEVARCDACLEFHFALLLSDGRCTACWAKGARPSEPRD